MDVMVTLYYYYYYCDLHLHSNPMHTIYLFRFLFVCWSMAKFPSITMRRKRRRNWKIHDNFQPNPTKRSQNFQGIYRMMQNKYTDIHRHSTGFVPFYPPSVCMYVWCIHNAYCFFSYQLPFIKEMHRCLDFTLLVSQLKLCIWKTLSKQQQKYITFCMCYFGLIFYIRTYM